MNLKHFIKNFIFFLNSKKIFYILSLSWILVIIFSYYFLPPATDDLFYFWPALNFYFENRVGMYDGDIFTNTYFQFPTFSILNGYFLKIYSFFNAPIDSFTYKIFNKTLILLMIAASILWIKKNSLEKNFYIKINIFLILISFTPFSLGLIGSVRPEILGILCVLFSIILFDIGKTNNFKNNIYIYTTSLLLGISFTVHPQFFLITSIASLMMLLEIYFKTKNFYLIFLFCLLFLIPVLLLFYWYYLGYPASLDFLLNRANYIGDSPLTIFKTNILNLIKQSIFLNDASLLVKLYQLIYTLPYLLLLILIFPVILVLKRTKRFSFNENLTLLIFVASLFNFTFIKTYDFYNGVIAFFLILHFSTIIFSSSSLSNIIIFKKNYLVIIFSILILFLNSFFAIVHTSKFLLSKNNYFSSYNTKNNVSLFLTNETKLFLTSEKLFGVFIERFVKNYINKNNYKTYVLFPFPDAGPTKNQLNNAKNFLNEQFHKTDKEIFIFGSKKISTKIDKDAKEITLFLNGNLKLEIIYEQIIFEDKENIFFIAKKFINRVT